MHKFLILIATLTWMLYWGDGQAVEFTVTTTEDTIDASLADGLCSDSQGECSLRAAIMQSRRLIAPHAKSKPCFYVNRSTRD